MDPEEFKKWVEEGKQRGFTEEELKKTLEKQGYSHSEIDTLFSAKPKLNFKGMDKIAIILVISIILISVIGFFSFKLGGVKSLKTSSEVSFPTSYPEGISECNRNNNEWCFTFNKNNILGQRCLPEQAECESFLIVDKALESNDISLCETIALYHIKDICYFEFATKNQQDPAVCEKISNENASASCISYLALALNNKELCNKLESPNREACLSIP